MKIQVTGLLDKKSWFYRNCRIQRKRKAKICDSCPFRESIEKAEASEKEDWNERTQI